MSNELIGNFSNGTGLIGNLGNSGSGTNNYNDLVNKPSINGITLAGNKSLSDLGINIPTKVSQLQNDSHYVQQSAIPTKTSQLQNDSGFAYAANLATVATTGSYNNLSDKPTIPAAQVNSDWNSNSGVSQILNKPNLAAVATSGSYDDLTNKPTIPAAQVNSDWNSNSGVSQILNKPNLAAVATSGNYSDLTNKPTLAAVATSGNYSDLINKPTLATVATSGSYNDLTNKPTIQTINSVLLAGTIDSTYQDGATIGYRNTVANTVDLTSILNYPTGKTILGYSIESVTNGGVYAGIGYISGTNFSVNTKLSGTFDFRVRVFFIE